MLGAVRSAYGEVDIVLLNGGGPKFGRFTEMTLADWDAAYRLLMRGMLCLLESLVPPMRARKWGRIVALTSTSVKQPIDTLVLSNAFRSALVSALRTLAVEVARDGVTVNCIATGRVETARLRALYGTTSTSFKKRQMTCRSVASRRLPSLRRWSLFSAASRRSYVTGQTISVDGGLTRGLFG